MTGPGLRCDVDWRAYIGEAGSEDDREWSNSASRQACEQNGVPLVCLSQARQKSPKQSIAVGVGTVGICSKADMVCVEVKKAFEGGKM